MSLNANARLNKPLPPRPESSAPKPRGQRYNEAKLRPQPLRLSHSATPYVDYGVQASSTGTLEELGLGLDVNAPLQCTRGPMKMEPSRPVPKPLAPVRQAEALNLERGPTWINKVSLRTKLPRFPSLWRCDKCKAWHFQKASLPDLSARPYHRPSDNTSHYLL